MDFLIIGLSYKTAPLAVREKIVLDGEVALNILERIKGEAVLNEALILSTCNRTEIYARRRTRSGTADYVCDLVRKATGSDALADPAMRYLLRDRQAVEHLFRVGSGLESMVLGETQILGQVKEAYSRSTRARTSGAFLNKLLHMTFRVAKKVRSTTAIGQGHVSVATAAIETLSDDLGGLAGRKVLLLGAGRNGDLAARHLLSREVGSLIVVNRSVHRARDLTRSLGGEAHGLDRLAELLVDTDAVLTTTSAPGHLISRTMVEQVQEKRRYRPLFFADIAAPRDIDPGTAGIRGVTLHDMDSLSALVKGNLARREEEISAAEALVREQADAFLAWYRSLLVTPIIKKLEEKTERMRTEELEKLSTKLDEEQLRKVDHFSRILIRRVLQDPVSRVKLCDRSTHLGLLRLDTIRDIFNLDDDE